MTTPVLLIDDGELDDVREILDEIGVPYEHLRGGAVPSEVEPPSQLFIATSRRALLAESWTGSVPYRVGVVTEDSNTLRSMLKRIGFDLLIRRPVHPYALRLIVLKAIYSGEERRRERRLPIGCTITFRSGLRRQSALLADLSARGCRILSDAPHSVGAKLNLQLPKTLGHRAFALKSRVVRCNDHPDEDGRYSVGLAFETMKAAEAGELRAVLRGRRDGPMVLDRAHPSGSAATAPSDQPAAEAAPTPTAIEEAARKDEAVAAAPTFEVAAAARKKAEAAQRRAAEAAHRKEVEAARREAAEAEAAEAAAAEPIGSIGDQAEDTGSDRREHGRAPYQKEIVSLEGEASLVLLGRDISVGGMRVEPNPDLKVGDSVRLAIYGEPRDDPFLVRATVARREQDESVGLKFENVPPGLAARLEGLVAKLPAVESLEGEEVDSLGSVISQILQEN